MFKIIVAGILALLMSLWLYFFMKPNDPPKPPVTTVTTVAPTDEPTTGPIDPTTLATGPTTLATDPSTLATDPTTLATDPSTPPTTPPTSPPTTPPTEPTTTAAVTTTVAPLLEASVTYAEVKAEGFTWYEYSMTIIGGTTTTRAYGGARLSDVLAWLGLDFQAGDKLLLTSGDVAATTAEIDYALAMDDHTLLAWTQDGTDQGALRLCPGSVTTSTLYLKDVVSLMVIKA